MKSHLAIASTAVLLTGCTAAGSVRIPYYKCRVPSAQLVEIAKRDAGADCEQGKCGFEVDEHARNRVCAVFVTPIPELMGGFYTLFISNDGKVLGFSPGA